MKGECVIVDFVRTPLCHMGGALSTRTVDQLACSCLEAVMNRTGLNPEKLDHVICGHAHIDTDPYNLAKTAWLLTRMSENTPGYTVHACGASGIMALQKAYYLIKTGNDLTVLAGGSESYSRAPYILREARYQMDLGKFPIVDSITEGELWTQPSPLDPRKLAEKLVEEKGYTAEMLENMVEQDKAAVDNALWENHVVAVEWLDRKKKTNSVKEDSFAAAENGFGCYVDGAAAMLVADEDRAEELGLNKIGRVLGFASAASSPDNRWEAAVLAVKKLTEKFGDISKDAFADIEIIADGAASTKAIMEGLTELGLSETAFNPVGGSLAYGINEGADGVIAAERCLLNLNKAGAGLGIVVAEMSGGQGMAMLIEAL